MQGPWQAVGEMRQPMRGFVTLVVAAVLSVGVFLALLALVTALALVVNLVETSP